LTFARNITTIYTYKFIKYLGNYLAIIGLREMTLLKSQAIQTALLGDWNNAISINQELLRENPSDTETLNRLAFAYSVIGKIKEAREMYHKVLRIDSLNPIALRGLKRLVGTTGISSHPVDSIISNTQQPVGHFNNIFLEETGKTKVVDLINIADRKIISQLRTGEFLTLCVKRLKIFALNSQKQYIGMLPDNIGMRLIKFLKGGNNYEAYIKSCGKDRITIFIKEVKRAPRFKNQPSFLSNEFSPLVFSKSMSTMSSKKKQSDTDEDLYSSDDEETESL